jgi:adenylosuccinate synthase
MKVCVRYSVGGEETGDFSRALPRLAEAKPVYQDMPSLYGLELSENHLPRAAEQLVEFLEAELRVKVTLVSTGEERSATIQRHA